MVTQLRLINYLPLLPRSSLSLWRSGSGRLGKVFVTLIIVRLTFELNFREKFTLICIRASLSWSPFCSFDFRFGCSDRSLTPFKNSNFLSLILPTLSSVYFLHLRSSDHHPSDNHSSGQALHLQCQPHHCTPFGLHFSPSWVHQQTPRSSANHSHSACHPSAALPSSQLGASFLWDQVCPGCPVAHHTEGWNCGTPMSQRISR